MNSARLTLLTIAFGSVIGGAIGFLVWGLDTGPVQGGDSALGRRVSGERRSASQSGDSSRIAELARSTATRDGAGSTAVRELDGETSPPLAPVVETGGKDRSPSPLEIEGEIAWTESVKGRAVDPQGNPLQGVTVVVQAEHSLRRGVYYVNQGEPIGRGYDGPEPIEEALQKTRERHQRLQRNVREATTDASGAFEVAGLPAGKHVVRAFAEGLVFPSAEVFTGASARLIGRPVGLFALDVRLPDGTAPDEASIRVVGGTPTFGMRAIPASIARADAPPSFYRWSPDEPEIRLSDQTATFSVLAGSVERLDWRDHVSDFVSEEMTIDLDRDGDGPHRVKLEKRSVLRVHVEDRSGLDVPLESWVKVVPEERTVADPVGALADAPKLKRGSMSGAYAATNLVPGNYVVAVGRGGGEPEVMDSVRVRGGALEHRVTLGKVDTDRYLIVRCVGPDDEPLDGVGFGGRSAKGDGLFDWVTVQSVERGRGEYWLSFESRDGQSLPADRSISLKANSGQHGELEKTVAIDDREVEFEFLRTSSILVLVDGDPSPGFHVSVTRQEGEGRSAKMLRFSRPGSDARVEADGRVRFSRLQPGRYLVALSSKSGRFGPALSSQEVTLGTSEMEVRFTPPSLHTVEIYGPGLPPGTRLMLRATTGSADPLPALHSEVIGENGRAVFRDIREGDYTLSSMSRPRRTKDVTVPSGEIVLD